MQEVAQNTDATQVQETGLMMAMKGVGVSEYIAVELEDAYRTFYQNAQEWSAKAMALVVTNEDQKAEMKMAREGRLALKKIRTSVEKTRKELKEDALRYGKAVDAAAKTITALIEPAEIHLELQEKFVELREAERKAKLKAERETLLLPFEVYTGQYDLGGMPEQEFQALLADSKFKFEAAQEARRKAEEERIAREKAEAEENERLRQENERLRQEVEEQRQQMEAQRPAPAALPIVIPQQSRTELPATEVEELKTFLNAVMGTVKIEAPMLFNDQLSKLLEQVHKDVFSICQTALRQLP